jgi:hypothetical protein
VRRPDWLLLGALTVLGVVPYDAAKALEEVYMEREIVVPMDYDSGLDLAIDILGGHEDEEPERGEAPSTLPVARGIPAFPLEKFLRLWVELCAENDCAG